MPYAKAALVLLVVFALPRAAEALGLGEIHVNSALDEPLAAEVEIVGATADDLAGITASVANSETFLRFGVDRPAFLSTATFRVAMDGEGRPILAIRSRGAFTEPLINMLIDLRWRSGEVVRQYTLLLDPPRFSSDTAVAEAAAPDRTEVTATPAAPEPQAAPERPAAREPRAAPEPLHATAQTAAPTSEKTSNELGGPIARDTVKVTAGATLRAIASRVGSRGDAGLERLMIAIFRANPNAFEGNINRLRLGAEITIPTNPDVSAISAVEASQEFLVQMDRWHGRSKFAGTAKSAAPAVVASAPVSNEPPAPTEPTAAADEDAALNRRVQALQQGLEEIQGALHRQQDTLAELRARVALADKARATGVPAAVKSGHPIGASIAALLVLASALGLFFAWRRGSTLKPRASPAYSAQGADAYPIAVRTAVGQEAVSAAPGRSQASAEFEAPPHVKSEVRRSAAEASGHGRPMRQAPVLDDIDIEALSASYSAETGSDVLEHPVNPDTTETAELASAGVKARARDANAETTPLEAVRIADTLDGSPLGHSAPDARSSTDAVDADTAKLQYKLLDLDGAVHHVPMPSILYEKAGFKERRTSLVDVLKVAVTREPNRRDLRMKLLETYHAAAATSRQGFLEVAQSLARERENMSEDEWGKIAGMGRQIAADDDLFATDGARADDKLATYA